MRISSSETPCLEDEMVILPVSSSKKSQNEDEIKRVGYFPMQQDMNFPKLFLHTISIIDYQLVTRSICRSCDKIGLSVTNSVTKLSLRIASDVTRSSMSLVEGKKTALLQSSKMCHDKVIFSFSKTRLFYLETFQVHSLFPAFKS